MPDRTTRYVDDLKEWELPRLQDREEQLVEHVLRSARIPYFDRDRLGNELYEQLFAGLRELATTAVNETIEYWLRGLADGHNGVFPELCVELPYIERRESVDVLTLAYCVNNQDGTRTELARVTLEAVLRRALECKCDDGSCARDNAAVVAALRDLAARLDCPRSPPTRWRSKKQPPEN